MTTDTEKPRKFKLPPSLQSAWVVEYASLDDLEILAPMTGAGGEWARKLLQRDRVERLDDALGDSLTLPKACVCADEKNDHDVIVGLVRADGALIAGAMTDDVLDISADDVAFTLRAFAEGSSGVVLRAEMPIAFLTTVEGGLVAAAPAGGHVVAVVDELDKTAVLDLLMVTPGPHVYRRHDGQWQEDKGWVTILRQINPPPIVTVTGAIAPSVIAQVDEATAGEPFEVTPIRGGGDGEVIDDFLIDVMAAGDAAALELLPIIAAQGKLKSAAYDVAGVMPAQLQRFWLYGGGAAKIRWGTPGAWRRCHRHLSKYMGPFKAKGACTNLGKKLGGRGVAWDVGRRR